MKIGIESTYLQRYGRKEGLARMRKQGYECIDLDWSDTETGIYLSEGEELAAYILELRRDLKEAGIEVSQVHGPWRWPIRDSEESDRTERFEKMAKCIRATHLLGCKHFVIHPIMPWGWQQDPKPEKMWQMNKDFFGRLLTVAVENQVIICFENMPMPALCVASPAATLRFAKEMNSPNFKVCLDTGHCTCVGTSPAEAVRLLGKEYLAVLHVHDNNGKNDNHWIPFTGVIDWADFSLALQEIGFEGCLSLETSVPPKFEGRIRELQEESLALCALKLAGREE